MRDNVVWIKEWLDKNKNQLYKNQSSTSQAIMLRNAVDQFKVNKTYDNAVDVQRYKRQLQDHMKESLKVVQ